MARFCFLLTVAIIGLSFMLAPASILAASCTATSKDGQQTCSIDCPAGESAECTQDDNGRLVTCECN